MPQNATRPGSTPLTSGPSSSKPRGPAWEVLEAESPKHLSCYHCKKLHPMHNIHEYAGSHPTSSLRCSSIDNRARAATYVHPEFRFTPFKMIMKQHRQGKNCEKLLDLLAYRSGPVLDGSHVKQTVATPKIVEGRLLMRVETEYVVPPTFSSQMYLLNRNLLKCPHTHRWQQENMVLGSRLVREFADLERVLVGRPVNLLYWGCTLCPTEIDVSLERVEARGVLLLCTKWLDLGDASPYHLLYPTCQRWCVRQVGGNPITSRLASGSKDLLSSPTNNLHLKACSKGETDFSRRPTRGWQDSEGGLIPSAGMYGEAPNIILLFLPIPSSHLLLLSDAKNEDIGTKIRA